MAVVRVSIILGQGGHGTGFLKLLERRDAVFCRIAAVCGVAAVKKGKSLCVGTVLSDLRRRRAAFVSARRIYHNVSLGGGGDRRVDKGRMEKG